VSYEFRQLSLVLELVARAGGRTDDLLARIGLPPESVSAPSAFGRVDQFEELLALASKRANDPGFSLTLAAAVPRGRFGWLEFASRAAATLDEAYPMLARYFKLLNQDIDFSYTSADVRSFAFTIAAPRAPAFLCEFVLAYVLGVSRQTVGTQWSPERAWFAHATPSSREAIDRTFGCPVSFDAKTCGMIVPLDIATKRFPGHDPALLALVRTRLDELMPMAATTNAFAPRARAEIGARVGRRDIGAAAIAKALGTSTRSLQRGLAAEGTTFADVVEDVRRTMAEALVARPELAIEQVAALLGYQSLRGFERAFKRWTGAAPTDWRAGRTERANE